MAEEFKPISKESWSDLADACEYVHSELEQEVDSSSYIKALDGVYDHEKLAKTAYNIGMDIMEPDDLQLGPDPDFPHAHAFYGGALLGMRLVDYELNEQQWCELQEHEATIPVVDTDADQERVAGVVFRMGERAYYKVARQLEPLLDSVADDVVEAQYRPYMKVGLGFVLEQARQILVIDRHYDMVLLRNQVMNGRRDWDEELYKLINGDI